MRSSSMSALFLLAATSGLGAQGGTVVEVRAKVLAVNGWPHGGSFAILAEPGLETLKSGRVDNRGELDISLTIPPAATGLVLIVDSKGMIRNTQDELSLDSTGATRLPGECEETRDWHSFRWDPAGIRCPQDLIQRFGATHALTLVGDRGEEAIDSVAARRGVPKDGVVDFGELRLPSACAGMEIVIALTDQDGSPFADRVFLTGFVGRASTPHGNRVYPHMSLSQRGHEVRIVLTRAAWRLLCSDVDGFVQLARCDDEKRWPCSVRFPQETRENVTAGKLNRVSFAYTWAPDRKENARGLAPMPMEPKFWWLGEPSFRW